MLHGSVPCYARIYAPKAQPNSRAIRESPLRLYFSWGYQGFRTRICASAQPIRSGIRRKSAYRVALRRLCRGDGTNVSLPNGVSGIQNPNLRQRTTDTFGYPAQICISRRAATLMQGFFIVLVNAKKGYGILRNPYPFFGGLSGIRTPDQPVMSR